MSCGCRCPPDEGYQGVVLTNGASVFSPWFKRRGDYLRATLDLIATEGLTLTVDLYTKNTNGSGNGAIVDAGTVISLGTVGRADAEWGPLTGVGLRELVRYRFSAAPVSIPAKRLVFRMLTPIWYSVVNIVLP